MLFTFLCSCSPSLTLALFHRLSQVATRTADQTRRLVAPSHSHQMIDVHARCPLCYRDNAVWPLCSYQDSRIPAKEANVTALHKLRLLNVLSISSSWSFPTLCMIRNGLLLSSRWTCWSFVWCATEFSLYCQHTKVCFTPVLSSNNSGFTISNPKS